MLKEIINLKDAELHFYPDFLPDERANKLFDNLLELNHWRQDTIKLFGKEVLQPRLTALFGEEGKSYTYSGLKMDPLPFPEFLKGIKKECEDVSGQNFTTCLANLYRDGKDSMGWHADDEKELGKNPIIASLSLGAERMFHLKHKTEPDLKEKIRLPHGSLLIMRGTTQSFWKHQLPKTKKIVAPRINLTFRKIY